jgi:hypothetical protein
LAQGFEGWGVQEQLAERALRYFNSWQTAEEQQLWVEEKGAEFLRERYPTMVEDSSMT